ncbi:MAG: hypothetical protein II356_03950 [Clostridia bacterium]|nr:hypothetical protein [Clostridia bacterium]MBQ1967110.1 hypothetical protein [Clostridia bacterium]MBQ1995661.1 hypothetical protein [Clostridia bacterium]MBQ5905402.1 hypothetical protein [Clostridia bacterium]
MTNSLSELSATYEKSIALQQEIIDKTRLKLKKASAEFNFKEIERLNSLLRILYDEKSELELSAYEMKKYLN